MLYVVLDPAQNYPAQMVEFLHRYNFKGIFVFSESGQYEAFHNNYSSLIECMADEYLLTEFANVEELAHQIVRDWAGEEIHGIIPWAEFGVELGAHLGEALQVDWNSREVIHRFRNKFALKEYLRLKSDVRINASRIVDNEEDVRQFQKLVDKWPIVVKPTEGAGSRNVFFAYDMDDLLQRCMQVFQNEDGEVLLEEYIDGNEFVVNGITDANHDILVTDVWFYDKRESHGYKNLYYETIKVNSYDPVFEPLVQYAGQVIDALGLRKSPFHMELKLDKPGPCLIEVGARFAGGNQPLIASRLHQRSLFELAACHYVANLPLRADDIHYEIYDTRQARIINGIQSFEIPSINAIYGVDEVHQLPSFFMIGFIKPLGCYLPVTKDMYGKSYEIYLLHEDPQQVAHDAMMVRQLIRYT